VGRQPASPAELVQAPVEPPVLELLVEELLEDVARPPVDVDAPPVPVAPPLEEPLVVPLLLFVALLAVPPELEPALVANVAACDEQARQSARTSGAAVDLVRIAIIRAGVWCSRGDLRKAREDSVDGSSACGEAAVSTQSIEDLRRLISGFTSGEVLRAPCRRER
jgi:hypothetical protein